MMEQTLENGYFRLTLKEAGAIVLLDKESRRTWSSQAPFRFTYGDCCTFDLAQHCRMKAVRKGNSIRITFDRMDWVARFPGHTYRKPDPGPDLKFSFKIELSGDRIVFTTGRIRNLDDERCSVEFPFRLLEWDKDEKLDFVYPRGYGLMVRFPRPEEFFQSRWGYFAMPIHGVFTSSGGIGVRILDPFDHENRLSVGTFADTRASVDSTWLVSKKFADYPRRLVWKHFPAGSGFVTMAKAYRACRVKEGAFVTLDEKIKQHPDVEKLVGAVIWKHSVYSQKKMPEGVEKTYSLYALSPDVEQAEGKPDSWNAYELFDTAHARGFDRLCVYNTGWNSLGYDSGYPRRFPVNPERGTEREFRQVAEYARSLSKDFIYSVHDNYCDVYRNSQEDIAPTLRIAPNGAPVEGGVWRGGRAYIQCTSEAIKYARRDIPKIAKMVGRGSIYIDVLASAAFSECHSLVHPVSRRQDAAARRRLMKFVRARMGSLASEALPHDVTADLVDLGAYMSTALESEFPRNVEKAVTIPLWQLVYHDSVLCFTNAYDRYSAENYHALCALFGFLPGNLDATSLRLSKELRDAYRSEMTDFRFLTPPFPPYTCVAESRFADGTAVIANMTGKPYTDGGVKIAPHAFIIKKQPASKGKKK